ncbi:chitinase [Amycolatopsis arida]|uniref:chitinase n=1 Tax=Amycolatopsis arida TaxID=587909 RepID=A0A1I6ASE1_9PSEU|nr:glycosyl hydrolase family 18 protein [Amycolatopsis arida]TDX97555.1 chitinase [Amycolatopsis arida]SFQ71603.1 chitinase [Amycolatopsis arida]
MRRVPHRLARTAVVALLAIGTAVAVATPARAAGNLRAEFTLAGTAGQYTVTNTGGAAVTGWRITFELPTGVTATSGEHATVSQSGTRVTLTPAYYIDTLRPGRSTHPYNPTFRLSAPAEPSNCRVDDAHCDGSPDTPPAAPANLRVTTVTTTAVGLAWDAARPGSLPVERYEVYRDGTLALSTPGTGGTVTGLTPNTEYTFTVLARDRKGTASPASTPRTVRTNDPADDTRPPTAPSGLRAIAAESTSATLGWTAATDDTGVVAYDVHRDGQLAATVTGTSAVVTELAPATRYTFTVRARDGYDNVSPASAPVTVTTKDVVTGHAKVGYFVQWGIYGRQYFVRNLDTTGAAARLTHLNYAFGNIDPVELTCLQGVTKGVSPDPQDPNQGDGAGDAEADYARPMSAAQSVDGVADTGWEKLRGNFNQLRKLKAKHPHLKVLISLGGWTYSKYFSDVAATDAARKKFVSSCIDIYIKGNLPVYNGAGGPGVAEGIFDGIDLDWEWPGAEGHPGNHVRPADKVNNTLLIAEFRRQLDELGARTGQRYQLTAFTPADPAKIDAGWELAKVARHLDIVNVQGYDFHGSGSDNSWEPGRTGHQGNLHVDPDDPYDVEFSVDGAVDAYLAAGVPARKLTIGLAFYGRGWQGVADGGRRGEWQAANGAAPGQFAEEAGTRGYANLVASVPNCAVHHDEVAVATYCYTGDGGQWWTFDDTWSIARKTAWLREKGLLGVMIWEMSGDTGALMGAVHTGLR